MIEHINEQIDCICIYKKSSSGVMPVKIKWNGRVYKIKKLGYHHKRRDGRYIYHIFSVSSDSLAFKLKLDTQTLKWWVEEVSDGSPN
jgi:hypothetical protein